MTIADIVILSVLALSMLFGLLRGFVREVLSLVCWIAAFWVAWAWGHTVAGWYAAVLHEPAARLLAGYVSCFVGVLIAGAIVGWILRRLVRGGGLAAGDSVLGMLFGLARGVLLVTFVVLMLSFTALPAQAAWWQRSLLLPTFTDGAHLLAAELPPDVTHYMELGGRSLPKLPRIPTSTVSPLPTSALQQFPLKTLEHAARRMGGPGAADSVTAPPGSASAGLRGDVGQ